MKRILHIIDHLDLGGAQSVLLDLVTLMDKAQWHCEVAAMHGRGIFAEVLEQNGIKVHTLSPSLWPPFYLFTFGHLQSQFDLLHFHLSGANWIAKPLAAMIGKQPRIAHDHASADLHFRGIGSMLIDAVMHRFSSHTIAVTPEVKKFLTHYESLSSESVTVIANGVNTKEFRPCSSEEKKEARAFFGLNEEDYIVGTGGRLAPEKNQALLLKAVARALAQGAIAQRDKTLFVIAGTGPQEQSLRDLANELGISKKIRFLGQVQNRTLLYQALDLFVLTSTYEGLPMVLLEAMASGIAVVSTDLEGIHRALEGGRHGVLIPPNDVEALSSYFLNMNQEEQKKVAVHARAYVESHFSAKKLVSEVERLYTKMMV